MLQSSYQGTSHYNSDKGGDVDLAEMSSQHVPGSTIDLEQIPKMTNANMIVLLLMPALIVSIFMICLVYLSGCKCKLGEKKGYKPNKNFGPDDKCMICLQCLDADKLSNCFKSLEEDIGEDSPPNVLCVGCSTIKSGSRAKSADLGAHAHRREHGEVSLSVDLDGQMASSSTGAINTQDRSNRGANNHNKRARSISWGSIYKQRLFNCNCSAADNATAAANELKQLRVVKMRNCAHSYHNGCIKQWTRNNNSCPLCKTRVNSRMLLTFHPHNSPYFSIITV